MVSSGCPADNCRNVVAKTEQIDMHLVYQAPRFSSLRGPPPPYSGHRCHMWCAQCAWNSKWRKKVLPAGFYRPRICHWEMRAVSSPLHAVCSILLLMSREVRRGVHPRFRGGNSLAGNQCQRWLKLFTVFRREAVQAPGLAVRWSPSVGAGARAGTRARREWRGVRKECRGFV